MYELRSGKQLPLHPDGVREATGVFEQFASASLQGQGAGWPLEECIALAVQAYLSWQARQFYEEQRHARARDEMPFDRGQKVPLRVVNSATGRVLRGDPGKDLDRWTPEGNER